MVRLGYEGEMSVIFDGVYVARYRACRDRAFLREHGITHVINCAAQSCESHFPADFTYLNLPLKDEPLSEAQLHIPLTPLSAFVPAAAYFIQNCLDNGGRVVVHCRKGISRSVSIVAGFLMLERGASLPQALSLIRERRRVADPNVWFVEDLKNYQFKLQMDRLQQVRAIVSGPLPRKVNERLAEDDSCDSAGRGESAVLPASPTGLLANPLTAYP